MTENKDVMLFSGGLDSFIAWKLLGKPRAIYINLGHKYSIWERYAIEYLSHKYDDGLAVMVSNRLMIGDTEMPDGHIPERNLLLLSLAALEYPDTNKIYINALAGETSKDKSGRFLKMTSRLLSYSEGRKIEIKSPFRNLTKTQLIKKYLLAFPEQKDKDILSHTRSCYSKEYYTAGRVGCGRCMTCFRRWVAMTNNGIYEDYQENPWEWEKVTYSKTNLDSWSHNFINTDIVEWLAILRNNYEAYKAIRKERK